MYGVPAGGRLESECRVMFGEAFNGGMEKRKNIGGFLVGV